MGKKNTSHGTKYTTRQSTQNDYFGLSQLGNFRESNFIRFYIRKLICSTRETVKKEGFSVYGLKFHATLNKRLGKQVPLIL